MFIMLIIKILQSMTKLSNLFGRVLTSKWYVMNNYCLMACLFNAYTYSVRFYGVPRLHMLTDFRRWGVRPIVCGETTVYHVPIYGRQPCTLASISLCSLIAHAFFIGTTWGGSSPLHRLPPAFPLLAHRAVNADKRYPLPRLLLVCQRVKELG